MYSEKDKHKNRNHRRRERDLINQIMREKEKTALALKRAEAAERKIQENKKETSKFRFTAFDESSDSDDCEGGIPIKDGIQNKARLYDDSKQSSPTYVPPYKKSLLGPHPSTVKHPVKEILPSNMERELTQETDWKDKDKVPFIKNKDNKKNK